ncbi:MAG: cell envelope protein [Pseudomonas sp.]|nr:cell envelope protein [Pseudomonas sp.]
MLKELILTALLIPAVLTSPAAFSADPSPTETRAIAKEAYIFGTPMIDMYKVMYAFSVDPHNPQYKGPFNSILNISRVFTPDDTAFVTPNSDTPYSFAGLDLRTEPVVLSVPAMEKDRYFVFQLMDLYTFNFNYIGTRTTTNAGGIFLIAGPDWKGEPPKGVTTVIRSETELVNVVGRTQLLNPADLDNVKAIQTQYSIQPLSSFTGQPAPAPAPAVDWIKPMAPKTERTSLEFFNQLAFLLQFAPTHPSEIELRERFASIGIVPGKSFDPKTLSAATTAALKQGMQDGQKAIDARRTELAGKTDTLFGTREYLKNDYVARATGAQVGIGANSRQEALYPIYEKDSKGQKLDGSKHRYIIKFAKGHFPPVNAFWSLTMYKLPSQLLVKNPINRYLINSPMLPDLKRDADGGLTLYLQNTSPGADKEANWLPAPKGPFMAVMRYYWPKQSLLNGHWKSPKIERVK